MGVDIEWVSPSTLTQMVLLTVAFGLSAIIGFERQYHLKAAGLKTHTLVGLGSAVFTLVSAYGFHLDGMSTGAPVDPSRVAAQIVSGIGFLGAGVIFVRHGGVSGLTTAASIWVTAAIGMACGAGAPLVAAFATFLYLISVGVVGTIAHGFGGKARDLDLVVKYTEGNGALRNTLNAASDHGIEALVVKSKVREKDPTGARVYKHKRCEATIRLHQTTLDDADLLVDSIMEVPGVLTAQRVGADFD